MSDRFEAERQAHEAWAKLLTDAQQAERLFKQASNPLPPRLALLLGREGEPGDESGSFRGLKVSPPTAPLRPTGVSANAIWVSLEYAVPTTLAIAVLREAGTPMGAVGIAARSAQLLAPFKQLNKISVYNALARVTGTAIKKEDGRYSLIDNVHAPVLSGNYLWGPPGVFQDQEKSAFRRMHILHVLSEIPDGLMAAQIASELEKWRSKLLKDIPVSKDVLKADLDCLRGHDMIKKISNSRKWAIKNDPK
jgi:hypothetical protein